MGSEPTARFEVLRAAVMQAGAGSVVSHFSAGLTWGLPGMREQPIHVIVPRVHERPARGIGVIHRSRDLGSADVVLLDSVPHTNAARTLLDLASLISAQHLDRCLQAACRQEHTSVEEILALVEEVRRRGRPGIKRMLEVLEPALDRPATESWLEEEFLRVIEAAGIPTPETQVVIVVEGHTYRVDNLWADVGLVVEVDGHATHSERTDTQQDAERSARLTSAGYGVVRFTYDDVVSRPRYVQRTVITHRKRRAR
ncbi:MAG TPA: DUF559 domain-containing protein [Acidimicrobiales bacterium]